MRFFNRRKDEKPKDDSFSAGDKVFITTFVKVYEAEIVVKDQSYDFMTKATKYIIKIPATGETLSVLEGMLTPVPEQRGKV